MNKSQVRGTSASGESDRAARTRDPNVAADFGLAIDSLVDYAFLVLDVDGRITGWNVGASRILGYCESEVLGQSTAIIFTPEDRQAGVVECEIETARRAGRAVDERWHIRKDGSRFWASGILTALPGEDGKPRVFAKIMRDITDRKEIAEALRQSEEGLRLLLDNVRDHALFQVSPDGRIATWNSGAESLFGYSEQEIVGQNMALLLDPEDCQDGFADEELSQALKEGRVENEKWMVRRDGSRFFAHWVTHLVTDHEGGVRGFVKVLRDDTERVQLEAERNWNEELARAELHSVVEDTGAELDRTKDELRALTASLMTAQEEERRRVALELHDDLSQRLALLEMQIMHVRTSDGIAERPAAELDRVQKEVSVMSELVRSLSHRLHPSVLEDLGLEPALRVLLEEFERIHGLALHLVIRSLPAHLPLTIGTTLYRITQEALRNIVKHAPEALVTVRVTHEPTRLRLCIEDDGPGFNTEMVRSPGGGLGLVSMRERALLVGGTVSLRSIPGSGTSIDVSIPFP